MARTKGYTRRHRCLLKKKRPVYIRDLFKTYDVGTLVTVLYNSSYQNARPHYRVHGHVGKILKKLSSQIYEVVVAEKVYALHTIHIKQYIS